MTVEEQTQNLDQFKFILDSLPISRAALKKSESVINSVEANVPTLEDENVAVCVKDENLIIDLNDTLAEVVNNDCADKDQEVPAAKSSRILISTSPVSLLLELSQRIQGGPAIIWDEFSHDGLFGCRVNFGDKFWIVPAEYSRKKEARAMVALMACIELIDDNLLFENVKLEKYESWTKTYVREKSDELARIYYNLEKDKILLTNPPCQKQDSVIAKPVIPSTFPTCDDEAVSYVALVNEVCQRRQINSPIYNVTAVNVGAIPKFRCHVENFSESPDISSAIMPSKRFAKNDAAKQIYEHMQLNGKVVSVPKSMKQSTSIPNESSRETISVIKNLLNCDPNSPIDPVTLIPLVMSLLTHISQNVYPEKNTLDGIYEMINQWKFFLDWKKQNNEILTK